MSVTLPTTPEGHDLGGSPFATPGIEYLGNQYLFVHQGAEFLVGDAGIHILKSTDRGLTWTDIASIDVTPSGGASVPIVGYTVCQDGPVAYILYTDMAGITNTLTTPASCISGPLYLRVFNLATDSLGGETSTGLTVYKNLPGFRATTDLVRRGPGDMLFVYSSIPELISSSLKFRISVATFNGSGFGSPVLIPGQAGNSETYRVACAGMDDTGLLHVIFTAGGAKLHLHFGMSGTGSGTTTAVTTARYGFTEGTSSLASYSGSIAFAASGTEFAYDKTVYHAISGTVNPTWDIHNIDTFSPVIDDSDIFNSLPFALHYLDGKLHLFWTRSGSLPDDWDTSEGLGVIQHSQAAATNLDTWTAENTIIGTPAPPESFWAAAQVDVYAGATIGLGIFAGFTGIDPTAFHPVENAQFFSIPPAAPPAPTVSCDSPPGGTVGVPYSHAMLSTHTGTFTVAVTAGALPGGLTMSATGLITGTPTAAGTFAYTATITDTVGTGTVECSITITAHSLGLGCASPPDGVVGVPYLHTFPVTGGTPPYAFAIISGILPPGLTLDSLRGQVSGTPTLAGDFEFVIRVSDAVGSTFGTCDITITVTDLPASGIGCGSPPEGEIGIPYSHTFPVTDIPSGATVAYSITGGALPPGLALNTATGQVTGTPTTDGHYHFTVTATIT